MIHFGICEDRGTETDNLKVGRIKVRVFGKHTEIKTGEKDYKVLTTENLPWAIPAYPINTQSIDGMSDFQVPALGSIVLVAFIDKDEQNIIYFGTIPKIAQTLPDWTVGFSDPTKQHPSSDYLKESPVSRLARNENIDKTIVKEKKDNVKTGISCKNASFDEPTTPYDATYTDNRVIETKAGHVIEIDDTEGAERIHIYHKSGSFSEYHPDGKLVEKVKKKRTSIILSDDNILIEGDNNIKITGSKNIQISKSNNVQIDQNDETDIKGDEKRTIGGKREISIGGDQKTNISDSLEITAGGNMNLTAPIINLN